MVQFMREDGPFLQNVSGEDDVDALPEARDVRSGEVVLVGKEGRGVVVLAFRGP